jgi:hypothetical protein
MSNYESLDHMTRYEHQNKSNKKTIPMRCQYINITLFTFIIVMNISVLSLMISQLYNFTHIFKSFKSNINDDITNFNNFLQMIPQLKEVLNIISNLCDIDTIRPYCSNHTAILTRI